MDYKRLNYGIVSCGRDWWFVEIRNFRLSRVDPGRSIAPRASLCMPVQAHFLGVETVGYSPPPCRYAVPYRLYKNYFGIIIPIVL
jgi:hypothetical protein